MIENPNLEPLPDLPPELAELDAELAGIRVAERPSFGPELGAELEREWLRRSSWAGSPVARRAMAASVGALLFTALAVPPARASLVTQLQRLLHVFDEPEAVATGSPTPSGSDGLLAFEPEEASTESTSPRIEPRRVARSDGEPLEEFPAFRSVASTYPVLVDLESDRALVRRHYPPDLQRRGVGGTVTLLLWVDSTGAVDQLQIQQGSGVDALNAAAYRAARELRFRPATRAGRPVGTYVTFDMVFEPVAQEPPLPEVLDVADPAAPRGLEWRAPRDDAGSVVPAPLQLEAEQLLRAALGEREQVLVDRFGPLEGLLQGDPPAGVSPTAWRSQASAALERALHRDPDNPAPYLALARIRVKQGLREDAGLMLDRGLDRARRDVRPVSPRLVAELAWERGRLLRADWLAWRDLGRLPATALEGRSCPRRPGPSGDVDTEILIAWNYLCPAELDAALTAGFDRTTGGERLRARMLESFREAVDAHGGHPGANVELLLDLADQGLWVDVLNGARRFAWATRGHPHALLLSGLALQRLGRSEEAADDLERALTALDADVAEAFRSVSALGGDGDPATFWTPLDPVLNTEVNERRVEHLSRAAYAHLRYGSLDGDAARALVRYDRPERVRTFGGTRGLRTEFWDYGGQGPDLTFTRPSNADELRLTPEADAYLDDLERVFPHRYGVRARALYTLPAQTARFAGRTPGTVEFEAHFAVPAELASGSADTLDLGLFLLGPNGERLSEERRRIPARVAPVRIRDDAGPGVTAIAVEVYNERTHQAASLRLPTGAPSAPISDLLLVAPAAPMDRDIGRSDAWVAPLVRADRLEGDQAGVMFELYGLDDTPAPYRIRVELVAEGSRAILPIEFRPSGQALFGPEWARRPAGRDGRAVEYLTLDLGAVGPGSYTLRTVVTLPDGERAVAELPGLIRRSAEAMAAESGRGLERIER